MMIDLSDLQKIRDALTINVEFHRARDEMNGAIHMAREVRWSPITSQTMAELERVNTLMKQGEKP